VPHDLALAPVYTREPGAACHSDVFDVDLLEEHIAHIRIYTLGKDAMVEEFYRQIVPLLGDARGVILDIRQNAGGNSQNGDQILEAFASQPLPSSSRNIKSKCL
jgi:C-terminal processing protease CtpA/Prc